MGTKKEPPSRYVTAKTFARALGIAEVTAWRWMGNKRVVTEKVGSARYILATEIDRHRALRKEDARNVPKRKR